MANPKTGSKWIGEFELVGWSDPHKPTEIRTDAEAVPGDSMVFHVAGPFSPIKHKPSTKTGAVAAYLARKHGVDVSLVEMSDVEEFLNDLARLGLTIKMKGDRSL